MIMDSHQKRLPAIMMKMMHSAIESIRDQVMNDDDIPPSKKSREIVTRLNELRYF